MTKKVIIDNIKNIKHMEFCIPTPGLYVVTGKNGSGKTTLFTCLSRIKNSNAFRTGFPASNGNDRLDFFSGYIQYEVDGESTKYSKRSSGKWKANKQNDVLSLMGYPQVVNITTKDERVFTQTDITPRKNHRGDDWINEKLNQIFGTDKYSSMIRITTGQLYRGRGKSAVDTRRRNIAYAIPVEDTPEVLLVKTYIERKQQFLQSLRAEYSNQQVDYSIAEQLDFTAYEAALPNFSNQTQYNSKIEERGSFRKKCKQVAEKIALELSQQLNITVKEVYRYSYKFAVENIPENELNVRALLAQTMKRVR